MINDNVQVSVIVPIYNVEKYLSRCVDSLLNQTLREIQIILVDDGSTDRSGVISLRYAKEYSNILYVRKKNGGLSDARNYGLNYAVGDYVGFIDPDDYIENNMFQNLMSYSENKTKKIVECNFLWEYPDREKKDTIDGYNSLNDYLINGRVVAWNKIYLLEWLKDNNLKFKNGILYEDLNFFFKMITKLNSIKEINVVPIYGIHYVQHKGTITSNYDEKIEEIITSYDDVIKYYKQYGNYSLYSKELEYKFVRNLLCSFLIKTLKISDRKIKHRILNRFWNEINSRFPLWRKNGYIRGKGGVNFYLRCINKYTFKLFYLL